MMLIRRGAPLWLHGSGWMLVITCSQTLPRKCSYSHLYMNLLPRLFDHQFCSCTQRVHDYSFNNREKKEKRCGPNWSIKKQTEFLLSLSPSLSQYFVEAPFSTTMLFSSQSVEVHLYQLCTFTTIIRNYEHIFSSLFTVS